MAAKRKVTFRGGTYYIAKINPSKCPPRCVRDGKPCAFRIRVTGMSGIKNAQTACGYMYYTAKPRNCNDPEVCDKWVKDLPQESLMTLWDEEENNNGSIHDER